MTDSMLAVEWIDSGMHIDEGWAHLDVYRSVAKKWDGTVTTVGFPIYEDDERLVLALSRDHEREHCYGAQLIAKVSITRRYVLTELAERTQ